MAAYSITVGGTERAVIPSSIEMSLVVNGLDTLSCDIGSDNGAYRPVVRDEVVLLIDAVPTFGGIITQAPEASWGGPAVDHIVTSISAVSFDIFASYRYVTETLASGTLKSMLTTLVAYLSSYGVSLHASQVNGPTVSEFAVNTQRLDEVLNRLSELTSYVWSINASKELRMVDPTADAAPFDILDTGTVYQLGDVQVDRTLDDTYANRVILSVSGSGPATSSEQFVASDGVSSGGETRFTAKYPASQSINDVFPNVLTFDGTPVAVVGFGPSQLPAGHWYWDYTASPAQLVYPESGGHPFPSASPAEVIDITYAIGYPFTVKGNNASDQSSYGIRESLVDVKEAMPLEAAQDLADALVADISPVLTRVKYETNTEGIRPGLAQTVTISKRNVDDSFIVQDVRMSWEANESNLDNLMRYRVELASGSGVKGNFRDTYKAWLGGGRRSGSVGLSATGSAGASAAPPDRAVQVNTSGAFGGSAELLHDYDGGGDTYGVEGLPSTLASMPADDSQLALALGTQADGSGDALTFWMSGGTMYVEQDGGGDLALFVYGGGSIQGGGVNVDLQDNSYNSDSACRILLKKRVAMSSLFLNCVRKTSSFTVDAAFAGGALPESVVFLDASSGTPVVTLPAVTRHTVFLSAVYGRLIFFKNIGSVSWDLTPSSGTIEGSSSYAVAAGASALVVASNVSGAAEWHVLAT